MLDNTDPLEVRTLTADEYPFYQKEISMVGPAVAPPTPRVPQGYGSKLDSETVSNIRASTVPTPQVLLPLGTDGKFPTSVIPAPIPSPAWSGIIFSRDGLRQYNLVVEDNGALSLDPL